MTTTRTNAILAACALALAGCGESHTSEDAAIVLMDGGPVVRVDAGGGGVDAGGGGTDAGGGVDGGPVTMPDGGPVTTSDGGPVTTSDGGAGTIACMGMTCDAATEQCCVMMAGGGASGACIPAGDTCSGATVDCDGPDDCASGEICCARGGLGGFTVACEPTSDMCGSAFGQFELCNTAADCTDPADTMCCPVSAGGFSGSYCAASCGGFGP